MKKLILALLLVFAINSFADGMIIVAKTNGDYSTIQEAVNAASESDTILVMPGTYNESVNALNTSIVGVNKLTCIVRQDNGLYNSEPIKIAGESYIANMTFISTHDDATAPINDLRAYAAHVDCAGAGTTEFNNCVFVSYQNAAIGSGLHQDQTLKLIDCELYSIVPIESTWTVPSAFFCHSSINPATNQRLIVKDCLIKTNWGYAVYINDAGSGMDVSVYNSVFYSDQLGKCGIVRTNPVTTGNLSGSVNLTSDSYGNNVAELNHP